MKSSNKKSTKSLIEIGHLSLREKWKIKWYPKIKPYLTPTMAISYFLAWMITNGWCYVFIALGARLDIKWMWVVGSTWAGILWFPTTVEKPFTFAIAVWLQKKLFIKNKEGL